MAALVSGRRGCQGRVPSIGHAAVALELLLLRAIVGGVLGLAVGARRGGRVAKGSLVFPCARDLTWSLFFCQSVDEQITRLPPELEGAHPLSDSCASGVFDLDLAEESPRPGTTSTPTASEC